MMRLPTSALALSAVLAAGTPALAEWQVWGYGGATFTHDSDVKFDPGTGEESVDTSWDGKSFTAPPYWGVRLTRWFDSAPAWGLQLDFNHIKTYAELDGTEAGDTFDVLEFTDGLNILTFDGVHRWQNLWDSVTPYAGAGVGVNIPHVEVSLVGDPEEVFEYQLAGYSIVAFGGVEYTITKNLSAFGEYKMSFASVDADIGEIAEGDLSTDLLSHHLNFGLSYKFGY